MPGGEGRVRCPRAWPHQPRTRAVRASSLPALRPACAVLAGSGCGVGGVKPAPWTPSFTKPGPGRVLGMRYSPWQEPWWNTGRRARPTADGAAQADLDPWRDRTRWCGADDSASGGGPLPFSFVLFGGGAERSEAHADEASADDSVGTVLRTFAHPTDV